MPSPAFARRRLSFTPIRNTGRLAGDFGISALKVCFLRPLLLLSLLLFLLPATAGTFPPERLASILHLCFQKRRKQLGTILKSVNIDINILKKMDIDPMLRPENLTPEVFQRLASASIFDRGD